MSFANQLLNYKANICSEKVMFMLMTYLLHKLVNWSPPNQQVTPASLSHFAKSTTVPFDTCPERPIWMFDWLHLKEPSNPLHAQCQISLGHTWVPTFWHVSWGRKKHFSPLNYREERCSVSLLHLHSHLLPYSFPQFDYIAFALFFPYWWMLSDNSSMLALLTNPGKLMVSSPGSEAYGPCISTAHSPRWNSHVLHQEVPATPSPMAQPSFYFVSELKGTITLGTNSLQCQSWDTDEVLCFLPTNTLNLTYQWWLILRSMPRYL